MHEERDWLADIGKAPRFKGSVALEDFLWGALDGFCAYADKNKRTDFCEVCCSGDITGLSPRVRVEERLCIWSCKKNSPCVQGRCQQEPRTVKTSEEEMSEISSDEKKKKKSLTVKVEGGRWGWRVERRKAHVCSRPLPTLGSGGDESPTRRVKFKKSKKNKSYNQRRRRLKVYRGRLGIKPTQYFHVLCYNMCS